jgi:hypothetical protein
MTDLATLDTQVRRRSLKLLALAGLITITDMPSGSPSADPST